MKRLLPVLFASVVVGCASAPTHTLRFHEQVAGNLPESHVRQVTVARTGERISIDPRPAINERDLAGAEVRSMAGGDALLLKFDLHGATLLSEMTTRLRGQYLVVLVDDRPVAALLVEYPLNTGEFLLYSDLTDAQLKELVAAINKTAGRQRDFGDSRTTP